MINKVIIRNFKRFKDVEFELPGHIVLAGPNNMGKTTLLQAIAAWGLALNRWKGVTDRHKHGKGYRRPKLDQLLGQGKPGEIIRNLLVEAYESQEAWAELTKCIKRMFRYEILPPNASGPDIIAEYREKPNGPRFDVASAGSGFQQVLMLLTFLHTRGKSVLLLDEPDAHLHVILQDVIYSELHTVALKTKSQLIIATHSEVIINSVEPRLLCAMLAQPRLLETVADKKSLVSALKVLNPIDIMQAVEAPGILYLEGHTDLNILREWARILKHPAYDTLTTKLFWQKAVAQTREGGPGVKAREHYEALTLVREDLPGVELLDGDAHPDI